MRILCLGGGPAGLYAGVLLKKVDPSAEVTIIERNPRGATYGWGVVFSDRTLAEFREADYPTYRAITDRFVLWEAIDIRYRDQLVRCGGHAFAGIRRTTLLGILEDRCAELGVEVRHRTDVPASSLGADHDLVVVADGVNSAVREAHRDVFRPRVTWGTSRFVWYGTERVLDSFTFIFREHEHGLFQVHAYPFDGTTSTWIVETDEQTWRRAGLHEADEAESIRFCEKLFADDLRGNPLLSNRSQWISFATVRCRTWRHVNLVLLGDAAHTAHFSIGSGTKLAMEDAISLARGFERHGEVERATADYEAERKPVVERLQEAADESREYFESTRRYLDIEPAQFAFHLLTRSGRIDYDDLRRRDPRYVDEVDRWFARRTGSATLRVAPPPLLAPLSIRGLAFPNRTVAAPPFAEDSEDGLPGAGETASIAEAASSGAAAVLAPIAAVSPEARISPGSVGLYREEHISAWARLADLVHRSSARFMVPIGHAGRRGSTRPRREGLDRPLKEGNWPLLAASSIPYGARNQTPREMGPEDMDAVRGSFAKAARAAARAGADAVLVHMSHGYLLAGFLSPLTNLRRDGYGGPLEKRMRYPLEVFAAVRDAWPDDRPVGAAIPATDWARGGLQVDDAVVIASALRERGCDLVIPLAGQTVPDMRPRYGPAYLATACDRIRNEAGVATLCIGAITRTGQVNTLVAGGRADLCVLDTL
jgi:anthraniloyl-CoA monooxygenase